VAGGKHPQILDQLEDGNEALLQVTGVGEAYGLRVVGTIELKWAWRAGRRGSSPFASVGAISRPFDSDSATEFLDPLALRFHRAYEETGRQWVPADVRGIRRILAHFPALCWCWGGESTCSFVSLQSPEDRDSIGVSERCCERPLVLMRRSSKPRKILCLAKIQ